MAIFSSLSNTNTITKILLGIIVLMLALSLYEDLAVAFWGDQDWELLISAMLLQGKKLYIDHVPVTGPLLFYLYALPVFVSQHLSFLEDYQAMVLTALPLVALVIYLCNRLMANHPEFQTTSQKWQWALLLCFLLIVRIRPYFVCDREHLFVILTLPYLLRFMPTFKDKPFSLPLRLAIGVLAAIGFCLKPHCLIMFIGIQIIAILYSRSLKVLVSLENITITILGLLYCAVIIVFTPEYFTTVLPFVSITYSALSFPLLGIGVLNLVPCLALTLLILCLGKDSMYRKDIYYIMALTPFAALYVYINNGWTYTFIPLMTILLLVNAFALWEFFSRKPELGRKHWKALLGIICCLLSFGLESLYAGDFFEDVIAHPCRGDKDCLGYFKPMVDEVEQQHAHSFGTLGMDFSTWTRVSKITGADWSTRFPLLWMMPKFIISNHAFYLAHQEIFYYAAEGLAEDLTLKKPDLVFAERAESIYTIHLSKTMDWVEVFSIDPAFKQAWQHYKFLHTIHDCSMLPPSKEALEPPLREGEKLVEADCSFDVFQRIP